MRFEAWPFVVLLALVPALLVLYARAFRERRKALAAFVEHELAPRLVAGTTDARRRRARAACLVGAVGLFVVALMQPKWGEGETGLPLRGRDIVVVLDVSLSMLAEDVKPNRLARAKAAARSLVATLEDEGGHRLALVTFAGRADVQSPLSRDYDLFRARLEAASVEEVAQRGSAIGGALVQAVGMLGEPDPAHSDIILLTDGEDHGGRPVDAARALAGRGFTLHTVGFGDPGRTVPVPVAGGENGAGHLVYQGQEVRTRMRRGILTAMAETGGGAYVSAGADDASLVRLYRDRIEAQPRREIESNAERQMSHRFQIFVMLAILLLGVEMVMREPTGGAA